MKALIIMYKGDTPAKTGEDELVRKLAEIVYNYTTCRVEDIEICSLDDAQVSETLLKNVVMPTPGKCKEVHTSKINRKVAEFCCRIIDEIGNPTAMSKETFCREFIKFVLNQKDKDVTDAIEIIVKGDRTETISYTLTMYGLSSLPGIIKDINPFCKLY